MSFLDLWFYCWTVSDVFFCVYSKCCSLFSGTLISPTSGVFFVWFFFQFTFLNQYHLLLLNVCYCCCFVYRSYGLGCSVRLVLVGLTRVTYFQLSIHATWLQDYIFLCCSWDSCWLPHSCWITLGQKFILLTGCPTRCLCCYKDGCCHVVLIWPMNDPIYAIPCFLTQPVFTVKRFRMYFTSTHWWLLCQNTVSFTTIDSLLTFFWASRCWIFRFWFGFHWRCLSWKTTKLMA